MEPQNAWACLQDLLLAVLVQSDDIKLAPNHAEMPSLLARMKPSALDGLVYYRHICAGILVSGQLFLCRRPTLQAITC